MMMMLKTAEEAEVEEVAEVAEVEETEEDRETTMLVDNKEDKIQRKHFKKPKKISQLYEREDHFDLLQKSWLIQLQCSIET